MEYRVTEKFGFECLEFDFMGNPARIIKPRVEANGRWALKTEYADAFPETEIELLKRGWHIAFNKNDNRWAEKNDLERKCKFAEFISREFALSEKFVVVGMSCGGLYAVKLAALIPERIAGLYLDAPVINLLSCPFALGKSKLELQEEYYSCTGRRLIDMIAYRDHPLDKFDILLHNNIKILLVSGDADCSVPFDENGELLEKYYNENGGEVKVYIKPGGGHHPHGLSDPGVLADYIESF